MRRLSRDIVRFSILYFQRGKGKGEGWPLKWCLLCLEEIETATDLGYRCIYSQFFSLLENRPVLALEYEI